MITCPRSSRGRGGRRGEKGLFIIQTSQPDHPVYSRLDDALGDTTMSEMLQERRDFKFPPFSRIVEITFKDLYEDRAQRMAVKLAGLLGRQMDEVTGPYAPVVDKIADQYIRTIRISLRKDRDLKVRKAAIKEVINGFERTEKYTGHISVNVDPA